VLARGGNRRRTCPRRQSGPLASWLASAPRRNDFGVSFNAPIPGLDNAMLLSDRVAIILDVEAVLQSDSSTG
jgi:hypothetical protein